MCISDRIYDLERLIGRISYQTANPRDLIAFKASLEMLPSIRTLLTELKSPLMQEILEELDPLEDLHTVSYTHLYRAGDYGASKYRPKPEAKPFIPVWNCLRLYDYSDAYVGQFSVRCLSL